jgi:hypothetical protein
MHQFSASNPSIQLMHGYSTTFLINILDKRVNLSQIFHGLTIQRTRTTLHTTNAQCRLKTRASPVCGKRKFFSFSTDFQFPASARSLFSGPLSVFLSRQCSFFVSKTLETLAKESVFLRQNREEDIQSVWENNNESDWENNNSKHYMCDGGKRRKTKLSSIIFLLIFSVYDDFERLPSPLRKENSKQKAQSIGVTNPFFLLLCL